MRSIVTGGAGFIGSHLVDYLVSAGDDVIVIDSLVSGDINSIKGHLDANRIQLVSADLLSDGWQDHLNGAARVYHLAADPDVRESSVSPDKQLNNTIIATHRILEAMRKAQVPEIVFTSTSTVYGEATVIPTPESYTPMEPVSVYGASKLACEALISAYCHSFSMNSWVFRFANIIGARSGHGVITDFIRKLKANPQELEILGDGKQTKSYLEVGACIRAIMYVVSHTHDTVNTFNIGSEDWISVTDIADILTREMNLTPKFTYTGGSRGWIGDVPKMQLDISRLKSLGFIPELSSRESVRLAVQAALE
ncbi:NAD-dependent epimerase/dehydratase family protein [Methanospirillum sp. J.3.6.1-F.2.7.3]|uniref:NAD-dependent epimerase/dehydratase family protein n=1 Tax=Methanospirillum purgamenti TaxID=2834276 RepID=A0A8E7AV54_9EURY|nr:MULTISPECIES: NAD-dependent epimerase/dehydratase family protein [Methanospirillum]MDX8550420.1 NAD-dependent epimerase/dehydratase family protein [Methanospirillum hungatei]NLW76432.1 NAD-dependent epimerase/dehydratase family protein [Methanomicrobiales archaeon]QVV88117.1 NAD-dependent epimerase/dehydratase family protein [Methanospirillum sp. J.3.6.1-F.2.7.3]